MILTKLKKSAKKLYRNSKKMNFRKLSRRKKLYLYAGDIPNLKEYDKFIGLSLSRHDEKHIPHDITSKIPLKNSCVDIFQAEDVFEHINLELLQNIINDIFRILKPNGIFRLSVPDYGCDLLVERTQKDSAGNLLFDPYGGGELINGKVINGGHVWFPKYELVKKLLNSTKFEHIQFHHYYDEQGKGILNPINYSIGFIQRTPDHDPRVQDPIRPLSLVVDCIKK